MPTRASMSNFPNRKLAADARCEWCDARMPAGAWVVPTDAGGALCSVSCAVAHDRQQGASSEESADDLRKRARWMQDEAEGLEVEAADLRNSAEDLITKADELDAAEAEMSRVDQQRLATDYVRSPATFTGPEIPARLK